jgi:cell division septation protein DedD
MNRKGLILLLALGMLVMGSCKTKPTPRELELEAKLKETQMELNQAQKDEREARFVPVTQEIIGQIVGNRKSLSDVEYYVSMPVTLVHNEPSTRLNITNGEVTYQEGNTVKEIRIDVTSQGELKNDPGINGYVFEVYFLAETITLNFSFNWETNRFDLTDAVSDDGKKYQMSFDGAVPHLIIYYNAKFTGNVKVQGFGDTGWVDSPPERFVAVSEPPLVPPQPPDPVDTGDSQSMNPTDEMAQLPTVPQSPVAVENTSSQTVNPAIYQDITVAPVITVALGGINPQSTGQKIYRLQVGAFREQQNSNAALARLKNAGFNPVLEPYLNLNRVLITGIQAKDLPWVKDRLMALGYGDPIIREEFGVGLSW